MYIQNSAMANAELRLRDGSVKRGDPEGIFDIDEEQATMLLGTKGWKASDKPPKKPEEFDPVEALKRLREEQAGKPIFSPPAPAAATPNAPPPPPKAPEAPAVEDAPTVEEAVPPAAPEEPTSDNSESEEDGETGPDLSEMGKDDLIAVAKEYGIKLTTKLKNGDVDKLRSHIDKALYGE